MTPLSQSVLLSKCCWKVRQNQGRSFANFL